MTSSDELDAHEEARVQEFIKFVLRAENYSFKWRPCQSSVSESGSNDLQAVSPENCPAFYEFLLSEQV